MKKLLLLLVLILLSPVNGRAKSPNCIEFGFNQSKFRNEKCISQPGLTFELLRIFIQFTHLMDLLVSE